METLQLFRGDTIIVRGKKRKDTGELSDDSMRFETFKVAVSAGGATP